MKKVLLIGDSIRLSYQEKVAIRLHEVAEVWGPVDNARFAKYTLFYIGEWMKTFGRPDIVHWNNGIWDTYRPEPHMDTLSTLDEYLVNLERVFDEIKAVCPKIIWATTTPVQEGNPNCLCKDIEANNKIACDFFAKKSVVINDLYSVVKPHMDEYICEDKVHLTCAGIEKVAEAVADAIKAYL